MQPSFGKFDPPESSSDDEGLIIRVQAEDPQALLQIVGIMKPIIKSQALRFRSSGIPLEDLMQHAWLHFFDDDYRRLKRYSPQADGTFSGFVATVTYRCLLNHINSAKRRKMDSLAG